jgi:hypothetical protein
MNILSHECPLICMGSDATDKAPERLYESLESQVSERFVCMSGTDEHSVS